MHLYIQNTSGVHDVERMHVISVFDFIILGSVTGKVGLEVSFIAAFVDAIGCDG